MGMRERVKDVAVGAFLEGPAKRQSFEKQARALEEAGRRLETRFRGAQGTPEQREVLRHIIGVERWGGRRVRLAAEFEGGKSGVRSPDAAFRDTYHAYKPTEATSWEDLIAKFALARRETVALAERLGKGDPDEHIRVPHNRLGSLSLRAWLRYLRLHAAREGRRIR